MAQLLVQQQEIVQALDQKTNEEAREIIKELQKKNLSDIDFADALKTIFVETDLIQIPRLLKYCKEFLQQYDNQIRKAQKNAERKVCSTGWKEDYEDCYKIFGKSFECNFCQNNFEQKKEINKHIKNEHKKKEIEKAVSEDEELLTYKESLFCCHGINSKGVPHRPKAVLKAKAPNTVEEYENRIELDKQLNVHHRTKIRRMEEELSAEKERADNAIAELEALKETVEESAIDDVTESQNDTIIVPRGKDLIIKERNSSITEGAYHGIKVRL